ncbi:metalloregulator ArsR/SmtB family transcription factor [Acidiphilium acidophilum]|jgi:Predicted transcriptional regulators|uniref:ArsR/SmtB family transcription factor n=1 Tax=Acidiphilium acidophilum TaxID=76588 RepID=UPI002E8E679A|nr:metalloregulator ArsR/SmtB family transcription factor [Acidiphilium acidophilum]
MTTASLSDQVKWADESPRVGFTGIDVHAMMAKASQVSHFLSIMANPHRIMILCHLTYGEFTVNELEAKIKIRQSHLSQQLKILRAEGVVKCRRVSRSIYYSLDSDAAHQLVKVIYKNFCQQS